jgi:hypothetical protein
MTSSIEMPRRKTHVRRGPSVERHSRTIPGIATAVSTPKTASPERGEQPLEEDVAENVAFEMIRDDELWVMFLEHLQPQWIAEAVQGDVSYVVPSSDERDCTTEDPEVPPQPAARRRILTPPEAHYDRCEKHGHEETRVRLRQQRETRTRSCGHKPANVKVRDHDRAHYQP